MGSRPIRTRLALTTVAAAAVLAPTAATIMSTGLTAPATAAPSIVKPADTTTDFTPLWQDDFNGSTLDRTVWGVYSNITGSAHRTADNISVHDGMVTLQTKYDPTHGFWTAAGMSATRNKALTQTYGEYEMRIRSSAGDSRVVALLWPTKGWPPEIDFMEMGGQKTQGTRQTNTQTVHYGKSNSMIHTQYNADMTQWHTVGVQWTPGHVNYLLDGVVMTSVSSPNVSNQPMWFGLQTATKGPTTVPVNIDMDWIRISKYTPGTGPVTPPPPPPTVTPPTVTTAPTVALAGSGVVDPTRGLPVGVSWADRAGSSAICSTHLQRSINAGAWTDVAVPSATATSAADYLPLTGGTVAYQVQATGCDGGVSTWAAGATTTFGLKQDSDPTVTYAGTWKSVTSTGLLGGTANSSDTGGSVSIPVSGGGTLALVDAAGPRQGAGKIYLDGALVGSFDNYSATLVQRKIVALVTLPDSAAHTLSFASDATAGHPGFQFDAVARLGGS